MWIKTSLAALGMIGALATAAPTSTLAQGVYVGLAALGLIPADRVGVMSALTAATPKSAASAAVAARR